MGIGGEGKWWDLELIRPVIGFGSSGGEEPLMGGEMMGEGIDRGWGIEGDGKDVIKGDKNGYKNCTVLFFHVSLDFSQQEILRRIKFQGTLKQSQFYTQCTVYLIKE